MSAEMSVFVITDDMELRQALRDELYGHEVVVTDEPDDADVVVISLNGYGATHVVEDWKVASNAFVLGLLGASVDGVDVLEAGADDFVHMPCPAREIAAKARKALGRLRARSRERPAPLHYEGLSIDPAAREVTVRGVVVRVPTREFDVLCFLASSPRRVFNRAELLHEVWHASEEWLGPRTVTEHIRRLRNRIEIDPMHPRWIRTVRGVGYRFDPEARPA